MSVFGPAEMMDDIARRDASTKQVDELAQHLHAGRWGPSALWSGKGTKRSYWRRRARQSLAARPSQSDEGERREEL